MGDQHNFAALEWVVGEIEETLDEARQALEAYVEDPKDSTRIRFCLTHIHQVLGSLRMVELNGPSLLAEEMEHVAQAIMNNNVSSVSDALEILMRSLLQLPIYLNHIKIYRDDSATHILPLLNDLRAVRKEHYLSESNLFAPNLSSLKTVQGKRHPILDDPKKLAPLLKKLREMYQFAAASVLRGLKVDENLDYLEKVFTRLETLSRGTSIHPLWSVASALIEGIKLDEIELSVGVRGLLRYLARDLRVLAEKSPTSFDQIPNTNVFKNLLFYVGRAGNTSSKITAIKARYDLIAALKSSSTDHDGASSSGPALDPEAIRSVVVALVDELNSIKMNLNNTLTGHLGTEELRDVLPVLKRVADTLAVLGISELRKQMLDQVTRLDALSRANELDEGELTLIATNIITVEQRLEAIGKAVGKARDINKIDERKVEIDEAKLVVVKECQFGLEKAKDAIIDYISSNWDASRLENIDLLLADIRGGLEIIPLLRPASIVRACSQFIKDKLVDDQEKPEWSLMESLADAIASVDYYLERLLSDMNEDVNVILDRAEESIKELGYGEMLSAPSAQEQLQAEELAKENDVDKPSVDQDKDEKTHENNNASSDHTNESIVPLAGLTVSNDESRDNTTTDTVTVEASELSTDIDNEDQSATVTNDVPSESNIAQTIAVEDAVVAEKPEDVVSEDRPEEVVAEKPTESIVATEKVVEQVVEKPAEEAIDDEEEDYIDEEILEIFIEEATEVLETLNEYLPQWIANNDDQEALTTVRRAFHTLKGSGRMVKASDISELAWEVENMLNRVIDNSVTLTPEYGQLIENVVGFLPPLVSAFEHKKGDPDPVKNAAYQEWAKLLSKGTIPDNLFVLGTPDTESSNVEETISSEPEAVTQAEEEHSLESSETFDVNTPEVAVEIQAEELQDDDDDEQEDMVLWEIFSSEAKSHLATIEEFVVQMEDEAPIYSPPSNDLQRALHTLKGSAKMAQVTNIAKMAEPLENFAKELVTYQVPLNDDILQLIRDAAEYTHLGLASIERGGSVEIPKLDQFIARTAELRELAVGHLIRLKELDPHSQNQVDPRLLSIFMAEEMLLLLDADQLLAHWEQNITDTGQIVELMSELSKLAEGAAQANLPDMALLSESLRCVYLRMMADELPVTSENIHDLYNGHNALLDMVDAVAAGQTVQAPPVDIVTRIQTLIEQTHVVDGLDLTPVDTTDNEGEDLVLEDTVSEELVLEELVVEEPVVEEVLDEVDAAAEEDPADEYLPLDSDNTELLGLTSIDTADNEDEDLVLEEVVFENLVLEELVAEEPVVEDVVLDESVPDTEDDAGDEYVSLDDNNTELLDLTLADATEGEDEDLVLEELVSEEPVLEELVVEEPVVEDVVLDESVSDAEDDVGDEYVSLDDDNTELLDLTLADTTEGEDEELVLEELVVEEPVVEDVVLDEIVFDTEDNVGDEYVSLDNDNIELLDLTLADTTEGEDEDLVLEELVSEEPVLEELIAEEPVVEDVVLDEIVLDTEDDVGDEYVSLDNDNTELLDLTLADVTDGEDEDLVLEELVSEEPVLEELVVEEPVVEDVVLDEIVLDTEDDAGDEYVSLDNDNTELLDLTLADTTEGQDEDLVLEELVSEEPVLEEPVFEEPATVEERLDMLAQDVQSDGGSLDNADVSFIPGLLDTIDRNSEDFDEDIVEVFLEEADELSEDLDEAIHAWQNDRSDLAPLEIITRALHTYKGGARLAALTNLGELTHDYETYLLSIKPSEANDTFFERIHEFQDQVLSAIRAVKVFMASDFVYVQADDGKASTPVVDTSVVDTPVVDVAETTLNDQSDVPEQVDHEQEEIGLESNVANDDVDSHAALPVSEQIAEKQETEKQEDVAPKPESAPEKEVAQRVELPARDNNVVPFARSKPATPAEPSEFSMPSIPNSLTAGSALAKKSAPQELVKVPAELLEELVNLAGETSISRSRLEEQVTEFSYSLDEIDATLHRMQEQIRRLDIETEAQILFRQEQLAAHEEFDPLEMDRYSQLQQLSRSLIESASDLEDLKTDLNEKLRDTETLLIQQSRINTSLQEGLMRSRMVPFSRLVPRLRRIVRQVAAELGKNVSFELDNIEGELDRTVLERMVPPFEHMLRNAVDHGIEMPEDRLANGKAEAGRIVLTLGREGGDVIIRLADDGRGINLKRVREKAIEREMMSPNAELSDHDVMQFILHSGFSTAENITQISGRGVGMDVVHSEIKQLGGSVVIDSEWGKGTEFVVRLPFTLSVNRALMVQIGSDQYAIPLSSIEGIVRVSPFELEHYYSSADAQFEYANENYHVRYLGSMLNADLRPKLEGHVLPLPVLLVRSAEHTMAIQVDGLLGSREVVVKSLGQQFSTVLGLSGATVMGDGSVVVILDPHALVRQEIAVSDNSHLIPLELEVTPTIQAPEQLVQTIMVVDDSVTVRKVTTRFLERQGFEVITAKDGVDALRVLQDTIPDLMLLDIEMPRMDGFEVAKNVRTTSRWSDLPIIMITSRTGEKHRDHAFSLGVNNYLGKPYQEDILLSAIHELLDARSATKH